MKKRKTNTLRLRKERESTDQGLHQERTKTDEELVLRFRASRLKTDLKVKKARDQSDKTLARNRRKEDRELRDLSGLNYSKKPEGIPSELELISRVILKYRTLADVQTKKTRLTSDKNRIREHLSEGQVAATLLNQERNFTNLSLYTERKRTDLYFKSDARQFNQEQNAKLVSKKALATHDNFLSIVSHDLRNALAVIKLSAESILDEEFGPTDKGELQELAGLISRHSENLMKVTTLLLDAQKITAGVEIELALVPTDIVQLARDSMDAFSILAAEKNQHLSFECAYPSLVILCDERRVIQVFFNLLSNAIKFTPTGGAIILKLEASAEEVRISIQDTGPGIPADQRKRIFDRYSQIQDRDRQGWGLGLFISKWITQAHGGKIGVKSSSQSGSTFYFTLPKDQKNTPN